MAPEDILATTAEIGIALAGFSGIVAVLGARAQGAWSGADRFHLTMLLETSFAAVLWSFVPLVLLSAEVGPERVWLLTSAAYVGYMLLQFPRRTRQISSADPAGPDANGELWFRVFVISGAVAHTLLQVVNAVWLRAPWPHIVAVLWALTLGFVMFVRLLRSPSS
jgi:hypothetical protein